MPFNLKLVSDNERVTLLAKYRELRELRDANDYDELTMDKRKELRKELKDMCDPIFNRYKQQLAADAAGTSAGNRIKSAAEDEEDESANDELMASICPTAGDGPE